MKQIVYVQILGHEYRLEVNAGEELYVSRLAEFVDQRMREIQGQSSTVDSYKLAVMAAMNIADELFRAQDSGDSSSRKVSHRADKWIKLLDQALQPAEPEPVLLKH